ncbi:glutaminase [Microbacterium sp. M3]|uniref:Glutaminase n=1 Tax=Microbacterium arthrosphaerae TaxID=792652 RepID=A0ABU4H363_9MICO|nr:MULTISPECIES: glutaminase [Microbacterium]MDW4573777.1 glutaminase [Microbacterium arthrosphaerae]MDW7607632.1 glutaminase [Microbacterium sp. M3]
MTAPDPFDAARARLAAAPREALGELLAPRRLLGLARAPRIVRRGSAWHLGVLLLTDDAVLATGDIIRARQQARRGYTAESQRRRAELAAAARRGGFAEGETVHIGWRVLDPAAPAADDTGAASARPAEASGPLVFADGSLFVRWSTTGGLVPLESYLAERVGLLLDPPAGA